MTGPARFSPFLQEPAKYVNSVAAAGADGITFHWEVMATSGGGAAGTAQHQQQQEAARELVARIRGLGCKAGVALAPDTPLSDELVQLAVEGDVDMVSVLFEGNVALCTRNDAYARSSHVRYAQVGGRSSWCECTSCAVAVYLYVTQQLCCEGHTLI